MRRKTRAFWLFFLFTLVFFIAVFFTACAKQENVAPSLAAQRLSVPPAGSYYHGVYPGGKTGYEDDITANDVASYEQTVGKRVAWVYFSNNWYRSRAFPLATATWIRSRGSVPFIRLMLRSSAENPTPDPLFTLAAINRGDFDASLQAWGQAAKKFGTPLIVEWGTEMNGFWFAWNAKWNGGVTGAETFRQAYRHIITTIKAQGATNITWVFHANWDDDPVKSWNRLESYYPGNDVIDWLGVSVYSALQPTDTYWTNFTKQMDEVYPRLAGLGDKPIMLLEFGATKNNPRGTQAAWAEDALDTIFSDRYPNLRGFSWWNETWQNDNNPAHDSNLRVQDNSALARAFKRVLSRESRYVITRPL
jgi:Glycosyl hydrolase family 26